MTDEDMRTVKEELGKLATRLDNVEGYFGNFDITLNNHMNDYKRQQREICAEQVKLRDMVTDMAIKVARIQGSEELAVTLIKWVIVPLIVLLAGLVGIKTLFPGALP